MVFFWAHPQFYITLADFAHFLKLPSMRFNQAFMVNIELNRRKHSRGISVHNSFELIGHSVGTTQSQRIGTATCGSFFIEDHS